MKIEIFLWEIFNFSSSMNLPWDHVWSQNKIYKYMIHLLYSNLLGGQKSICGEGWIGWLKICMVDKITQVIIILGISGLHSVLVRLDLHLSVRHNLVRFIKTFYTVKVSNISELYSVNVCFY